MSAGTSDEGLSFAARHSELIFIGNRPPLIAKVKQLAAEAGRSIKVSTNLFIVARKTDAEAEAEYALIQEGVDMDALNNVRGSFDRDNRASTPARTAYLREPAPVGFGMGAPMVGSPATVARKIVRLIVDLGFDGVQFTFVDYVRDLDMFSAMSLRSFRKCSRRKGLRSISIARLARYLVTQRKWDRRYEATDRSRAAMRILSVAIVVAAQTPGLTLGAESPSKPEAVIKGDGGTIRLLVNPSGSQSFPGFVIKRYGLDKKYGFDLQTIPAQTAQSAVVAIQSGGAEIGAWNWPDAVRMRTAGTKVMGIGPVMKWANTVVVPAKSTI